MMQTSLPAIHPSGRRNQSPAIHQHRIHSPPAAGQGGSPTMSTKSYLQPARRSHGMKDRELAQKQQMLKSMQPDLSKRETAAYRNTYMHNLCLDMLQQGYHKSFSELFRLVQERKNERDVAGPESILWNALMLDEEPDKLENLKVFLTRAEAALRREDYAQVYEARYELARYFQSTRDKWLSDHFFSSCLETSASVMGDGRHQAEAHCNVGLAYEESGDHYDAADQFESFHAMSQQNLTWKNADDKTLFSVACEHLCRVYAMISNKVEVTDPQGSLTYLIQAYDMAKASENTLLEGKSAYRLGKAHEKQNDPNTALRYLNSYLEICKANGDDTGMGQACEAIAKAYESQGKIQESIRYLQMFCDIAEKSKLEKEFSQACSALGAMYNSLGQYDKAVDYFGKAYNLSRALNDSESIGSSRVFFGIAQAHHMLLGVANHIDVSTRPCLERLIDWKSSRQDELSKEIPSVTPGGPAQSNEKIDKSSETPKETPASDQEMKQEEQAPPDPEETQEGETKPEETEQHPPTDT